METEPMSKDTGGFLSQSEIAEFATLLDQYHPSQETLDAFAASKFAVIAGPAGAGKDTLRNNLLRLGPDTYSPVLSTTTRPMRPKERDGVDYHFVSKETMRSGIEARNFLQAELVHSQQISAMNGEEFQNLGHDRTGLSILVVKTEHDLREYKPDIKTIFLVPPSLEVMKERLSRATRKSDLGEINRRLSAAREEIAFAASQDEYYCIVTKNPVRTAGLVDRFLATGERDYSANDEARRAMQQILDGLSN